MPGHPALWGTVTVGREGPMTLENATMGGRCPFLQAQVRALPAVIATVTCLPLGAGPWGTRRVHFHCSPACLPACLPPGLAPGGAQRRFPEQ